MNAYKEKTVYSVFNCSEVYTSLGQLRQDYPHTRICDSVTKARVLFTDEQPADGCILYRAVVRDHTGNITHATSWFVTYEEALEAAHRLKFPEPISQSIGRLNAQEPESVKWPLFGYRQTYFCADRPAFLCQLGLRAGRG